MAKTLKLEIATARRSLTMDDVTMVTLPGVQGQLGVYPDHTPLLTPIQPGEVIVQQGADRHVLAVGEGMAEILSNRVVLLADMAIPAEELDEHQAQEALRREEQKLKMKLSEKETAAVSGRVARLVAQTAALRDVGA